MTNRFTEKGNEYLIYQAELKRPMLNYFWNKSILVGVNHQGGGLGAYRGVTTSFIKYDDKPRAQLIRNGHRYFYIKDEKGELWNPGWYPTRNELSDFQCTHGIGYSKIAGTKGGTRVEICGTTAGDYPIELWRVTVSNLDKKKKTVKVYPFVEFALEGYPHASDADSWERSYYFDEENMIFASNDAEERPHPWHHGFAATSIKPASFESSKNKFIGKYGFICAPDALKKDTLSNSIASCEDMVGVFENVIELDKGETKVFYFAFGLTDSIETAKDFVKEVFAEGYFDKNLAEVVENAEKLSGNLVFDSPDKKVNNMVNYWLKKQVQLCSEVGRGAGKGFRDSLQDAWAIAAFNPAMAKEKIKETLEHINSTGISVRGWNPLKVRDMSDSSTWVAPTINAYLKETRDFAFLDEKVKYLDHGEDTVWEHILTVTRHGSDDTGARGLVLAREGDWNDSLNHLCDAGKGESVWSSMALYNALLNVAQIAKEIKNDPVIEKEMLERAERMRKAVEENAWDGEWYLAGYNDKDEKVGTKTEKEGMIYLNTQTWAAITGISSGERLEKAIASADKYCYSDYGPLTLYPAYTKYNPYIGRLTGFVPGIWENGCPYCHGGAFKAVSDCVLGRGDHAYQSLKDILPDSEKNPSTHSGCEPYALTNMYLGPDNLRRGETASAWITGTAGWIYRAFAQYMAGFHCEYDTIKIDPCLPSTWKYLNTRRLFRGAWYEISVENPNGNMKGVKELWVDGEPVEGNVIPVFNDNATHKIKVII